LTPALLLQGFSFSFGGILLHRLHTPRFLQNLYPWLQVQVSWGMGVGNPGVFRANPYWQAVAGDVACFKIRIGDGVL